MSKCTKCKKGDMHPVDRIFIMNRFETEITFMCDKCGDTVRFKK